MNRGANPSLRISPRRLWIARGLAIAADLIQIVIFPLFLGGAASPANNVLDVALCVAMIAMLGFHIAFLPTLVAELLPVIDLFPTWTAAVFFVTRSGAKGTGDGTRLP